MKTSQGCDLLKLISVHGVVATATTATTATTTIDVAASDVATGITPPPSPRIGRVDDVTASTAAIAATITTIAATIATIAIPATTAFPSITVSTVITSVATAPPAIAEFTVDIASPATTTAATTTAAVAPTATATTASSATTDTTDLDHFAHFEHLEIGYTWAQAWMPRINADFDYASGDDNPRDSDNERFDTLFGARRFDFGPTGMYGPFARSNLLSPGLRLNLQPTGAVKLMVSYRGFWLASDTDAWTTSGVRDRSGATGSFIGLQIEARLRWEVVPGNYRFEAGVANLFAGGLMRDAPNSPDNGDVFYAYTQAGFNF